MRSHETHLPQRASETLDFVDYYFMQTDFHSKPPPRPINAVINGISDRGLRALSIHGYSSISFLKKLLMLPAKKRSEGKLADDDSFTAFAAFLSYVPEDPSRKFNPRLAIQLAKEDLGYLGLRIAADLLLPSLEGNKSQSEGTMSNSSNKTSSRPNPGPGRLSIDDQRNLAVFNIWRTDPSLADSKRLQIFGINSEQARRIVDNVWNDPRFEPYIED